MTELDRTVEYSYDSLYRLTSETITEDEKATVYTPMLMIEVSDDMWVDYNDKIMDNIFVNVKKSKNVPYLCEVCNNKSVHLYMHIYNNTTKRGGVWIWCSSCHSFWHSSIYVPSGWKNCSLVEKERLCALPIYLDSLKTEIDKHTNKLINDGVIVFGHIF